MHDVPKKLNKVLQETIGQAVLDAGVTTKVFANRPKAQVKVQDFAVVRVAYQVDDLAAYGTCSVRVALFARDVENVKNGKRLGLMYDALISGMPAEIGRYMISRNPLISPDIADDYGFHARIVTFKITIKVQ